jgi:hypothetical protein
MTVQSVFLRLEHRGADNTQPPAKGVDGQIKAVSKMGLEAPKD